MNETRNENNSKKSSIGQDQFKSTKKWNEIIESFYSNMPLKRHWKNFRTFNDCFTASEAIDWTYRYLKSSENFQHLTITKTNAIKLLQIFLKERIIEDVRAGENYSFKEFQDDDRIYKFCSTNSIFLKKNAENLNSTKNLNSNISEKQSNMCKNDKSSSETELNSNFKQENLDTNKEKIFNSTSVDNLSGVNKNFIQKRNSSTLLKSSDIFKKESGTELFIKNPIEFELWSKSARKILESVLRKAYLHKNSSTTVKNEKNGFENNDCILTPKLSSTLKRSNDIKISLTNMLSKKSCDTILKISGSNIEHNMNNINKHGVVINTEDDLPVWVIRAMHTLLNWKSDNNSEYPKFSDVFEEIAQYFSSIDEPLLTTDLSDVFIEVLNLMINKSSETKKNEILNFENLIFNSNLNEDKKAYFCLNYRILDMIVSSFEQILAEANVNCDTEFLIDNIEKHLLENARLNIFEDPDDDLNAQTEILKYREEIYFNLLVDCLARLQNCCTNCKCIYKEINQFIRTNESQNYKTRAKMANSNQSLNLKRLKTDFDESILESIHSSKTRLHRNNSFKAAIGDKMDSNEENKLTRKPFVIRTSTNNSNDFNFVRSFMRKGEIILNDDECENFELNEENTKSLLQIQKNVSDFIDSSDYNENFKSLSKSLSNQNICSLECEKMPRKRKLSSDEGNVDKLAMIFNDLASSEKNNKNKTSKLTSSLSLSYFNKDDTGIKRLCSSMSLQNFSNKDSIKRNLNDLNLFIKNSLNRHTSSDGHTERKKHDQSSKSEPKMSKDQDMEDEMFDCLLSCFRLLAVMLPPSNKRKLHFLLRFLNRLKSSEHFELYNSNLNKTENVHMQENENFDHFSWKNSTTSRLDKCQSKLDQVEYVLVKTFLKSIISFKLSQQNECLSVKAVQILINNYSDIMRIPSDLITNFKTRLKNANNGSREKSSMQVNHELQNSANEANFEKRGFRNFIDTSENKPINSKKLTINSSQQGQKIKKALNILGLNDSISYPSLNQRNDNQKLSKDNILTANLNENNSKNSHISFEQSFNQLQSTSYLNSSVISNYPSKSSLFQSTSSINFPRIFSNKKWKKENLI